MLTRLVIYGLALSVMAGCKSVGSFTESIRMFNPMGEQIEFIVPAKSDALKPYDTVNVVSIQETQLIATRIAHIFERANAEGYYKQVNHPEYMSDVEKYRTENNNWLAKNIMKVGKPSVSLVTLK